LLTLPKKNREPSCYMFLLLLTKRLIPNVAPPIIKRVELIGSGAAITSIVSFMIIHKTFSPGYYFNNLIRLLKGIVGCILYKFG